jgi:hypothetical protein
MTSTGYVAKVVETAAHGTGVVVADVSVSITNNKTPDTEAVCANAVPDSVVATFDRDEVYTTPTLRSHLTTN